MKKWYLFYSNDADTEKLQRLVGEIVKQLLQKELRATKHLMNKKKNYGDIGKTQNMNNDIQFILYQLPDEEGRVQVVIKDETIWAGKHKSRR